MKDLYKKGKGDLKVGWKSISIPFINRDSHLTSFIFLQAKSAQNLIITTDRNTRICKHCTQTLDSFFAMNLPVNFFLW